jgi:2-methylcitrate dehydratase MmgE/PrpD-like protein
MPAEGIEPTRSCDHWILSPHPPKRLLSHVIAEWAYALKYEDLSPAAIEAAKLFWFDSIGCALGGSQQDDARILLKHYRAMGGNGKATTFRLRLQDQSGRCLISQWPHDSRDGSAMILLEKMIAIPVQRTEQNRRPS